jgi:hypothetical protein
MIGSCVDVTTLLARAFAPGKASALLSFNKPAWSILPMTLA